MVGREGGRGGGASAVEAGADRPSSASAGWLALPTSEAHANFLARVEPGPDRYTRSVSDTSRPAGAHLEGRHKRNQ